MSNGPNFESYIFQFFLNLIPPTALVRPVLQSSLFVCKNDSLYETAIVSTNDELVNQFLKKKIKFSDIEKKLIKLANSSEFVKLKKIKPKNINDIIKLDNYVRLKLSKKV